MTQIAVIVLYYVSTHHNLYHKLYAKSSTCLSCLKSVLSLWNEKVDAHLLSDHRESTV